MLTESEILIQQSIAAWFEANDLRSHYPVLISLKELQDCTGIGDLAVLWTMAEIVAAVNRNEPGKLAKELREKIGDIVFPQPIPQLLIAKLERAGKLPEFQALLVKTGHSLESLLRRLKTPVSDITAQELPARDQAMAYFQARQPAAPEWTLTFKEKLEYLRHASYLLFHDDRELTEVAACSIGYGRPNKIYDLMKRIISLQGKAVIPVMLKSPFASVRAAAAWPGINREPIWPLLHDSDSLVRAAAVNAVICDLIAKPCTDQAEFAAKIRDESWKVGDILYADQLNYLYLLGARVKHYLRYIYPVKDMPMPPAGIAIVSLFTIVVSGLALWFFDRMFVASAAKATLARILYWSIAGLVVLFFLWRTYRRERKKMRALLERSGRYWPGPVPRFKEIELKPGPVDGEYFGAVIIFGTPEGLDTYIINENERSVERIHPDGRRESCEPDHQCSVTWRSLKRRLHRYRNFMLQVRHCGLPRHGHVIINAFYSRPGLKPLIMAAEEKLEGNSLAHEIFRKTLPGLIRDINQAGSHPVPVTNKQVMEIVSVRPPHCLNGFIANRLDKPFPKAEELKNFLFYKLACPCGHDGFSVNGYSKKESTEKCNFYPPLSLECTVCGKTIPLYDPRGDSGNTWSPEWDKDPAFEPCTLKEFYRIIVALEYSATDDELRHHPEFAVEGPELFSWITVYGATGNDNWESLFDWESD